MQLSPQDVQRCARHLALPEVGMAGQRRLRSTSVLCVGTGGLGSPALLYVAAAGVGKLGVVDFDTVERSNLQRQIIHRTPDVGRPKAESARDALNALNPDVEVVVHQVRLTRENAFEVLGPYDLVLDGTDNFASHYLANDACALLRKPTVYGSIFCGASPRPGAALPSTDEVSVRGMKEALDDPKPGIQVLDIREPYEHQLAHVPGVSLLPLGALPQRYPELDPRQAYYLCCHSGTRSLQASRFLREQGFECGKSVRGGLTPWSEAIDPSVPKYWPAGRRWIG